MSSCLPTSAPGQKPRFSRASVFWPLLYQPCALAEGWVLSACLVFVLAASRGQERGAGIAPHHHHVPGATRPQARHPQGRAPAPWAATHGGVLCQWHDQALSWKLTEGRQRGKRLDFLLCTPWIAPQTHRSRRIEGKNAQVLSPSALKSHHFSVGLKGCADPLRSFASALD